MVKDLRQAAQQALEAMKTIRPWEVVDYDPLEAAITALRTALAEQPAGQKPVGEVTEAAEGAFKCEFKTTLPVGTKLYTAPQPAKPAQAVVQVPPNNDLELLLRQVFAFCEATEDATEVEPKNEHQRGFDKGRRFEAKQIRRSIGDWFQAEFCGRSFMGEPVVAAAPEAPQPRRRLSDEEVEAVIASWWRDDLKMKYAELCRAIEAAVWGEKT